MAYSAVPTGIGLVLERQKTKLGPDHLASLKLPSNFIRKYHSSSLTKIFLKHKIYISKVHKSYKFNPMNFHKVNTPTS